MKRRKRFRDLITANSNLTYSRYWRLVALASLDFIFTIPFATWGVVGPALWSEVRPWGSWADPHWVYSRVFWFPRVLLDPISAYSLETTRWAAVLCAFYFFGFFRFADEARKNYRILASTITRHFGYTTFSESAISDSYAHSSTSSRFRTCAELSFLQYGQIWDWLEDRCFTSSVHRPTNRINAGFFRLFGQALDVDHHRRLQPRGPAVLSNGTVEFVEYDLANR